MGKLLFDLTPGRWWRGLRLVTLHVLITLLAGCGTASSTPGGSVNLGGFSPAFKQGYADGCESAGSRKERRNEARYQAEADYMQGWNDGFSVCRR